MIRRTSDYFRGRSSLAVVNEARYIQHNPQTLDDGPGLAELFKKLSERNPKVRIVRMFSDGDFVFGHTEYIFIKNQSLMNFAAKVKE